MNSKLQIRAKILEIIEQLDLEAINETSQQKIVNQLKKIDNKEVLSQLLVRELNTDNELRLQKVAYLLLEINNFEVIKKNLWDYIKSPDISDRVKEISCTLLRAYGEKILPEDLIDYMENPIELIDAETRKLLDIALVNPEVQIDFLDFLFALGESEKLNLIKSLEEDYEGDSLVNIVAPILDATDDGEVKEAVIKILGGSKSYSAVKPLQNVINFSKEARYIKSAEVALKILRIAGIDPEDDKVYAHDSLLCKKSKPYKCFVSEIDGLGNQGVIVSRIDEEDKIQMFSAVISDVSGVVDCFGFYSLTQKEFEKIVQNFDQNAIKILVSPEYAKARIINAENVSRAKQLSLPYEYVAWKALIHDFVKMPSNLAYMVFDWAEGYKQVDYELVLNSEIFSSWFFEPEDNTIVSQFLEELFQGKVDFDLSFNYKIISLAKAIFDSEMINIYVDRLCHVAYIVNVLEEESLRGNIALLAKNIQDLSDPGSEEFFLWIIKRTIFEAFLREKEKIEYQPQAQETPFCRADNVASSRYSKIELDNILENLQKLWES